MRLVAATWVLLVVFSTACAHRATEDTATSTVPSAAVNDEPSAAVNDVPSAAVNDVPSAAVNDVPTSPPRRTSTSSRQQGGLQTPGTPLARPSGTNGPEPTAKMSFGPVAPGSYRYDTDGSSTISGGASSTTKYPPVTTISFHAADGSRQKSVQDMRDARGNGSTTDTVLDYQRDGIHLAYIKVSSTSSGITQSYAFSPKPEPLVAPQGAPPGYHVSFTMTDSNGTTTARVTLDILSKQDTNVGGAHLETAKVRTVTDLSGQVSGRVTTYSWNVVENGLPTKQQSSSDIEFGLNHFTSQYKATLQRATPG